jgi:ABC-2 type transport system permease protein
MTRSAVGRGGMTRELWALLAIAQRDLVKLLRDRPRLAVNVTFPILLVAGLGSVLQPTVGPECCPPPCSSPPPRA